MDKEKCEHEETYPHRRIMTWWYVLIVGKWLSCCAWLAAAKASFKKMNTRVTGLIALMN